MSDDDFSTATEVDGLRSFLDGSREALINAVGGLSEDQARRTATVSALSLLGLLKHSAIWERRWFQVVFAGRDFPGEWPDVRDVADATFALTDSDTVASVVAHYREQVAVSNDILTTRELSAPCARQEILDDNLRWVALHLLQETAQHVGHADIIREAIDGKRGGS